MSEEIMKHQMECRSSFKKEVDVAVWIVHNKIDSCNIEKEKEIWDLKTQIAVFNNISKTMQKDIKELKEIMTNFINSADTKYAKKATIDFMSKVMWVFWISLFTLMTSVIGYLITTYVLWNR